MRFTTGCVFAPTAALALSAAAFAAPQESVTYTSVASIGEGFADAANTIKTNAFTGAYTAQSARLAGTLTVVTAGTYASEARVYAMAPTGGNTVLQPFTSTTWTGSITVPAGYQKNLVTPGVASGTWTFRFYESYWDDFGAGADATWDTITITLDDAPVSVAPPPSCPTGFETVTFTAMASNGPQGDAGNSVKTATFTGAYLTGGFNFSGRLTGSSFNTEARFKITRPDASVSLFQPISTGASTDPRDVTLATVVFGTPIAANAGTWTFESYESFDDAGLDGTWSTVCFGTIAPVTPPACPSGTQTTSFTGMVSNGPIGDAGNSVKTATFTGTYLVGGFNFSGRLTGSSFNTEARFKVTAPGGTVTLFQPITAGASTDPRDVTLATVNLTLPVAANAGTWSFESYDSFDDPGVDGTWSNACFGTVPFVRTANSWYELLDGGADADELCSTAQRAVGSGTLSNIFGSVSGDTDAYIIHIDAPAAFSATTVGNGNTMDTQLFLFNPCGSTACKGVVFDDDTTANTQSALSGALVPAAGYYILAITGYNRDPQDSAAALLWNNTPFVGERAPDGPAAANAMASWVNTGATGAYTIALTGCSLVGATAQICPNPCHGSCVADFDDGSGTGTPDGGVTIDDLLYYLFIFDQGLICADVDDGSGTGTQDGGVTIDDLLYFLFRFDLGC